MNRTPTDDVGGAGKRAAPPELVKVGSRASPVRVSSKVGTTSIFLIPAHDEHPAALPVGAGCSDSRAVGVLAGLPQLIVWKMENTGRYRATIMPPITTPMKAIMSGSMRAVSCSVVDSTSFS